MKLQSLIEKLAKAQAILGPDTEVKFYSPEEWWDVKIVDTFPDKDGKVKVFIS